MCGFSGWGVGTLWSQSDDCPGWGVWRWGFFLWGVVAQISLPVGFFSSSPLFVCVGRGFGWVVVSLLQEFKRITLE